MWPPSQLGQGYEGWWWVPSSPRGGGGGWSCCLHPRVMESTAHCLFFGSPPTPRTPSSEDQRGSPAGTRVGSSQQEVAAPGGFCPSRTQDTSTAAGRGLLAEGSALSAGTRQFGCLHELFSGLSRSLRVLKFRINSAFLGFQMMNFCFGEGNGQLKQAGKPKPLTKAAG